MPNSPILQIPQVSTNQNQKETTINNATAILEAAMNDAIVHTIVANADLVLNETQWTRYFMHRVTGHTEEIAITNPARARFFVVSNEGTGPIMVTPVGGGVPETVEVPAGKIVLMVCSGTANYAVSSGVSTLTDLADVITTPVEAGQVLYYDAVAEMWKPGTIAEVLTFSFLSLSDTPSDYTDDGTKLVRVNAGGTGLEFVVAPTHTLLGLTDGPDSYVGQAYKVVAVKETEDGFEFVDAPPAPFTSLIDAPTSYVGEAGKFVAVNATEDGVEFVTPPAGDFLGLSDTPADYTGQAGKAVVVNATEDGVEFVVPAGGGGSVAVQDTDVEVVAAAAILNFEGDGVSVTDDGAGKVTITVGVAPTVGPFGEHAYWRVRSTQTGGNIWFTVPEVDFYSEPAGTVLNSGGTAISGSNFGSTVPANAFDDNTGTEWTSATGGASNGTGWIGYQFVSPVSVVEVKLQGPAGGNTEALANGFVEYSDDGVTWTEAWQIAPQASWSSLEIRTFNYDAALTGFLALPDAPDDYIGDAGKKVRVNSGETGLEFVADTFLSQTDTPANYTGAAKKKVRVNSAGNALEFVTNAIEIETTKTAAYTTVLDDADNTIPVNVATAVDVTIPTDAAVAYPVGTQLAILQLGVGQVGFVGDTGVTVNKPAALTNLTREQFSVVMALKIAADSWVLLGDLEPTP